MEDESEVAAPSSHVLTEDLTHALQRLRNACIRTAASIVRDRWLAEEVVQESFLAAWQHAPVRYDPRRGSLESWILTLTRHKAVDAVRHAEHVRRVQRLEEAEPRRDRADLTEDLVLRADDEHRLRRVLHGLPPAQQRVLLLMYWYGLSQTQISHRDGTPLGTVKSRTTTALQRLRNSVTDHSP